MPSATGSLQGFDAWLTRLPESAGWVRLLLQGMGQARLAMAALDEDGGWLAFTDGFRALVGTSEGAPPSRWQGLFPVEEGMKLLASLEDSKRGGVSSVDTELLREPRRVTVPIRATWMRLGPLEPGLPRFLLLLTPDASSMMATGSTPTVAVLRELAELSAEGVWLLDGEDRVLYSNPVAARMLGYRIDEMPGLPLLKLVHPESQGAVVEGLGVRRRGVRRIPRLRFRRKDGAGFTALLETSPLLGAGGEYLGALGRMTDLTSEANAATDAALRESERLLAEAQEMARLASFELDVRENHIQVSPQMTTILGRPIDPGPRALGHWLESIHPDDRAAAANLHETCLRIRGKHTADFRLTRSDGQLVWLHCVCEGVFDDAGQALRVRGALMDITARKEVEAQLLQADRLASLGALAGGIAHEINNPLSYVLANLDFLAEELKGASALSTGGTAGAAAMDERLQSLMDARHGAERVLRIVRDLKTFARKDPDEHGPADVAQVLELSLNMALSEIRRRARLVRTTEPVPPVALSETRLGQVILNLLLNAAHAIPEGKVDAHRIHIQTRYEAGRVIIEVSDTGTGIPESVRSRIFDPFFTTKPVGVGTGLGLSISHSIIQRAGGDISFRSEEGRGTTFRVSLPVWTDGPRTLAFRSEPSSTSQANGPLRILVAEGESLMRRALERLLGARHQVTLCADAAEALAHLQAGASFDVILCELDVPPVGAETFHESLRTHFPEYLRRLLFMGTAERLAFAATFFERTRVGFVEKPIDMERLRERLARFANGDAVNVTSRS